MDEATRAADLAAASDGPPGIPVLTVPKGGGAIQGMGEKFAVTAANGTGALSVPIHATPGRSDFGPSLSLAYDSSAGNGAFGFGWGLSVPKVVLKTDRGLPRYDGWNGSDIYMMSGFDDLVPSLIHTGTSWVEDNPPPRTMQGKQYQLRRYRPRLENAFALIERWSSLSDPHDICWRSLSRDNVTTWYGRTDESRVRDPADPSRIFSWLICESHDDKGNAIVYRYAAEDDSGIDLAAAPERNRTTPGRATNRYLKRIQYGNRVPYFPSVAAAVAVPLPTDWCFELVFDYGEHNVAAPLPTPTAGKTWPPRPDPFSTYRPGFEVRTYRLCRRVLMFHHFPAAPGVGANCLVRSTDLTYSHDLAPADPSNPIYSFLVSVQQKGYRRDTGGGYVSKTVPPLRFEYSKPVIDTAVRDIDAVSLENLSAGAASPNWQWLDLDGEGSVGALAQEPGALFFKRNLSAANLQLEDGQQRSVARFAPLETIDPAPCWSVALNDNTFMDLADDGQMEMARFTAPTPGFFERNPAGGWQPFRAFTSLPNLDWSDPNLHFVDLTGDGRPDLLITQDDVFCWHESQGELGFGPQMKVQQAIDEDEGPRVTFADPEQSVFLADLSGDGLIDLVRIRNGEVCYWPSLGYGRFGAKVAMASPPLFETDGLFDARRIRLVDVDGSGTSDIIYIGTNGIDLYFNQSGNSWSPAHRLGAFPATDSASSVAAVDLLGIGTACLVWSSPLQGDARQPVRYLDLMGGRKPHLLIGIDNNLGAETRIDYAPSTRFYVADLLSGKPWVTRLPFPVHVVERVVTWDHVSRNRYSTQYAYHHGYFDGVEREFRGFGMVEQWDGEELAALTPSPTLPAPSNIDDSSYVPRVLTRSWFHVGAYLERGRLSSYFAGLLDSSDEGEYYREPGLSDAQAAKRLLDDTLLPDGLSVDEEREACRALKGALLREEVFALDGSVKQPHPYSVREQNYGIVCMQPRGPNALGVFFTHPRESITYGYERNPADPRTSHELTLEVDAFGNVRKALAIAYGRRQPDPQLIAADQEKQRRLQITYTESDVTNAVPPADVYRTPLPSAVRIYELTGYTVPSGKQRFDSRDWTDAGFALLKSATDIPFETEPNLAIKQRRQIGESRTYYRSDNLASTLPLHVAEPLGLRSRMYTLVMTPGLIAATFQRKISGAPPENLLPAPAPILSGMGADQGGYVDLDGDGRWWRPGGRTFCWTGADPLNSASTAAQELAEARKRFFLPQKFVTCFGQVGTADYDTNTLLAVATHDAVGNIVTAEYDYRVLQPKVITDANGNQAETAFDAFGQVAGTAMHGKPGESIGDTLTGFNTDPTSAQLDAIFDAADPHTVAPTLLAGATSRTIVAYDRFSRSRALNPGDTTKWQPVYSVLISRETHVSDLQPGQQSRLQIAFSYSDGLGRLIQDKRQAEPGPVVPGGPVVSPRWVGSGWTIFNNKGSPVRRFEPFFSALATHRHQFEFGTAAGVAPVIFYDPLGRVVATLHPNGSYEKIVFDSWTETRWDVNDTCTLDPRTDVDIQDCVARFFALQPPGWQTWRARRMLGALGAAEKEAATQAALHALTPTKSYLDTLGRRFLTLADNGPDAGGKPRLFATRYELDIQGHTRQVRDAIVQGGDLQGRIVVRYVHDMIGTQLYQTSFEAGGRWTLSDAAGKPIRGWNSRRYRTRYEYDSLRRPFRSFVQGGDPAEPHAQLFPVEINFLSTVYGDSAASGLTPAQQRQRNLRMRVHQLRDGSGLATTERYDFKGNPVRGTRQFTTNYRDVPNWSLSPALEAETFAQATAFDALDRAVAVTSADGSITEMGFNEAGLPDNIRVKLRGAATATVFVRKIEYDAKGQRTRVEYGLNGATAMSVTEYNYEPDTFRLRRMRTTRTTPSNGLTSQLLKVPGTLQDLNYTYDAVGNVTRISDDALPTIIRNGETIEPQNHYTYDAVYRLIEAQGREHAAQCGFALPVPANARDVPFAGISQLSDPRALRNYTEQYQYDPVGNFLQLVHTTATEVWTRTHDCLETSQIEDGVKTVLTKTSNRLTGTTLHRSGTAPLSEPCVHDIHGNIVRMSHLPLIAWDFADRLRVTSRQQAVAGREQTFYVYDAAGRRTRKVTERPDGTPRNERRYLPGVEIYREYTGGAVSFARESLHVSDSTRRIALVETETVVASAAVAAPANVRRFQFGNHLGSCALELDAAGAIISYEEYHPFGTSALQAGRSFAEVSLKRYRYTGKERDEETGWAYHGARYLAPWLGRWTSADPIGIGDGVNLYRYVSNNPIKSVDPNGTQESNAHTSNAPPFKSSVMSAEEAMARISKPPQDCAATTHHFEPTEPPLTKPEQPKHPLKVNVSSHVAAKVKEQWNAPNSDAGVKAALVFSVAMMATLYPLEMVANTPDLFETSGEHLALSYYDKNHSGYHLGAAAWSFGEGAANLLLLGELRLALGIAESAPKVAAAGAEEVVAVSESAAVTAPLRPGAAAAEASKLPSPRVLDPSIPNLNPGNYCNNCAEVATNLDQWLGGGKQVVAGNSENVGLDVLEYSFANRFRPATTKHVVDSLRNRGPGARGLLAYGQGEQAHVVNVINWEGRIVAIDGQNMTFGSITDMLKAWAQGGPMPADMQFLLTFTPK